MLMQRVITQPEVIRAILVWRTGLCVCVPTGSDRYFMKAIGLACDRTRVSLQLQ